MCPEASYAFDSPCECEHQRTCFVPIGTRYYLSHAPSTKPSETIYCIITENTAPNVFDGDINKLNSITLDIRSIGQGSVGSLEFLLDGHTIFYTNPTIKHASVYMQALLYSLNAAITRTRSVNNDVFSKLSRKSKARRA